MAKEIFTIAGVMWALTLTGLSVGFGLLKIQGEQKYRFFNKNFKCLSKTCCQKVFGLQSP